MEVSTYKSEKVPISEIPVIESSIFQKEGYFLILDRQNSLQETSELVQETSTLR